MGRRCRLDATVGLKAKPVSDRFQPAAPPVATEPMGGEICSRVDATSGRPSGGTAIDALRRAFKRNPCGQGFHGRRHRRAMNDPPGGNVPAPSRRRLARPRGTVSKFGPSVGRHRPGSNRLKARDGRREGAADDSWAARL